MWLVWHRCRLSVAVACSADVPALPRTVQAQSHVDTEAVRQRHHHHHAGLPCSDLRVCLNPLLVWLSTLLRYLLSDSSVVRHSASPYCFLDSNASGG